MALYNTVPAEGSTLLAPKKDTKTKGLVVVAAVAAFDYGRTQFWRVVWTTGHFYLQVGHRPGRGRVRQEL